VKTWIQAHPGYAAAASKRYREAHPEAVKTAIRRYYKNNKEKYQEWNRDWRKRNPEKIREMQQRTNTKTRSTPQRQLSAKMSSRICRSLQGKKKNRRWESVVDFTLDQLKRHTERHFTEGMSWELYMKGKIHIDHIIPVSAFNFTTPEDIDFKKCWCLKNLQPMWAKENQSKKAKLKRPFQPSLLLHA